MTTYTPGPWTCNANYSSQHYMVWDANGNYHEMRDKVAEMDANARLIAAAPELLEALQGAIETADGTPGMSEAWWYSPARQAIDKATQGQ